MTSIDRQQIFEKIFKEHLKVETYAQSIATLLGPRRWRKIDYSPSYQRNYVWDDNKASYFIESILLGTEIPPLVFFTNQRNTEVIDGRQRIQTIYRFHKNDFALRSQGLQVLKQLKGLSYEDFVRDYDHIVDTLLDAKIRIIEFRLVNEPPLDAVLEDQVKKEIFSRYNSGITPLKRSDLDNAVYDDDSLSNAFKGNLSDNPDTARRLYSTFFKVRSNSMNEIPVAELLAFVRRFLTLPSFPINQYARGHGRTELLEKLYQKLSDDSVDEEESVVERFLRKALFLSKLPALADEQGKFCNRLALECFLWGLGVLDLEGIEYELDHELANLIVAFVDVNRNSYTEEDYAFQKAIVTRYLETSNLFRNHFAVDLSVYVSADDAARSRLKALRRPEDATTRISELEHLRLNKPEPTRLMIEDVVGMMRRGRFLVRPTYQRKEVINPNKMSSIIESILLGITLPTLFIFKRSDGVSEVIDGQQRILTLLGFLSEEYVDEKGKRVRPKSFGFRLRKLRVLREVEGLTFSDLDEEQQERLYEFPLVIVEISESQNPSFNPVDLFIRLNDKPFPIREHSFEMWNSWADVEIIERIKALSRACREWFFVKMLGRPNDRDRMENEELIFTLVFLAYMQARESQRRALDVYQKTERINMRLTNKSYISKVLQDALASDDTKKFVLQAVKEVEGFVRKVKLVLLDRDKSSAELATYLREELDQVFRAKRKVRAFKRTKQDFYALWDLLSPINSEMVRARRLELKSEISDIFAFSKNIPENLQRDSLGLEHYFQLKGCLHEEFSAQVRYTRMSGKEKRELLQAQGHKCAISGAPLFVGDDIDVDHREPLATGGSDTPDNLQLAHRSENQKKGCKNK